MISTAVIKTATIKYAAALKRDSTLIALEAARGDLRAALSGAYKSNVAVSTAIVRDLEQSVRDTERQIDVQDREIARITAPLLTSREGMVALATWKIDQVLQNTRLSEAIVDAEKALIAAVEASMKSAWKRKDRTIIDKPRESQALGAWALEASASLQDVKVVVEARSRFQSAQTALRDAQTSVGMYFEYLASDSHATEETREHLAWHHRGFTGEIPACIQEQERIRQQEFLADATPLPKYRARFEQPQSQHEPWDVTARRIRRMVDGNVDEVSMRY